MIAINATVSFATPTDVVEMSELSKKYIEYGLGWYYTSRRLRDLLRDDAKNVVVAREGDNLMGFGIMTYAEQNANLDLLAVKSRYRRRGVGRQVVSWLEEVARTAGIVNIFVQVRKTNPGAIAFYQRCGYRIVEEVSGYYRGTETAVIMCKGIRSLVRAAIS